MSGSSSHVAAIIVAAGSGQRAKADNLPPKQYRPLAGEPILARSVRLFLNHPDIDAVLPVIAGGHEDLYAALGLTGAGLRQPVTGGATRQASVLAGLQALDAERPDLVLIHDAARPLASGDLISRVIAALDDNEAALPTVASVATLKRSADQKMVEGTLRRDEVFEAQTPQGFRFDSILQAHRDALTHQDVDFTDDASIAEHVGIAVVMVAGARDNIKITEAADFELGEHILGRRNAMETRTGSGLDIHRFVPGDTVRLAEVDIAHTHGLAGHSDADAALHVLTDALLGAVAMGDIGRHFPPTDPQWRGEPSRTFLAFAVQQIRNQGGRIVNLDLTLMCEEPKIGPHADKMRANVAGVCGIDVSRVSIKATTAEKMSFVGRGEGLFAHAVATVEVPRGE